MIEIRPLYSSPALQMITSCRLGSNGGEMKGNTSATANSRRELHKQVNCQPILYLLSLVGGYDATIYAFDTCWRKLSLERKFGERAATALGMDFAGTLKNFDKVHE